LRVEERAFAVLFAIVLAIASAVRVQLITDTLPYPRHIDEPLFTNGALNIMKTGDFNPHFFMKPSLPLYLTLAGFTFGYLRASQSSQVKGVENIGSVAYPYYTHRAIVRPARMLFAAISVLGLGLAGIVALQLSGWPITLFLAPLLLSLSSWFLNLSWSYVNPDIVGCTLSLGVLAYVLGRWAQDGLVEKAVVPGLLCGLAVGSKYNFAPVVLTPLLAIWLAPSSRRITGSLWLGAFLVAGFLAAAPYTLLDFRGFLEGFGRELRSYATWRAATSGPYWARVLRPFHNCVGDYGAASALFATVGLFMTTWRTWRRSVAVLAFPLSLALVMASYPLYYPRNVLVGFAIYAVFAAIGVAEASRALAARLLRTAPGRARVIEIAAPVGMILVLLVTAPFSRIAEAYAVPVDSRNQAVQWISKNVPQGATLLVPTELSMNVGSLHPSFAVVESPFARIASEPVGSPPVYALVPAFDEELRGVGTAARLNELARRFGGTDLARFGRHPVVIGYISPVPWGDPAFVIRQLEEPGAHESISR
jgi:hypothetical protein